MKLKLVLTLLLAASGIQGSLLQTKKTSAEDRNLGIFSAPVTDRLMNSFQNHKALTNVKMMMTNKERENELNDLESQLSEIAQITEQIAQKAGSKIDEINDSLNSKMGRRV